MTLFKMSRDFCLVKTFIVLFIYTMDGNSQEHVKQLKKGNL